MGCDRTPVNIESQLGPVTVSRAVETRETGESGCAIVSAR